MKSQNLHKQISVPSRFLQIISILKAQNHYVTNNYPFSTKPK